MSLPFSLSTLAASIAEIPLFHSFNRPPVLTHGMFLSTSWIQKRDGGGLSFHSKDQFEPMGDEVLL